MCMKPRLAVLFSFFLLVSPLVAQSDSQETALVKANTQFALKYLNQMHSSKPDENVLLAPTTLSLGFGLLQNGADDREIKEIAGVFERPDIPIEQVNNEARALLSALPLRSNRTDQQVKFSTIFYVSNSLWIDSPGAFRPDIVRLSNANFLAEVHTLTRDIHANKLRMDSFLKKTMPPGFQLSVPLLRRGEFALVTATSFEGRWEREFAEAETHDGFFKVRDGTKSKVRMMRQARKFPYFETDEFQGICLSYNGGQRMFVLLPQEKVGIDTFVRSLTPERWQEWSTKISGAHQGTLVLPKFKIEAKRDVTPDLQAMGLTRAFQDFASMERLVTIPEGARLTRVLEDVRIDVNEKRTIVQSVGMVGGVLGGIEGGVRPLPPPPFYMIVDHPFVFVIEDESTHSILYVGVVMNPST